MPVPLPYALKRFLRICDCWLTRRKTQISFRGRRHDFFSTLWWDDVSQEIFDQEIAPYFDALRDFRPSVILDVGAATGHFGIVAAQVFPKAKIYAFEPALRQRILMSRNGKLNRVDQLHIEPFGLWKCSDTLAFRTNGAESSFAPVSRFKGVLEFPEMVPVRSLDGWVVEKQATGVDLIKMDAEGAEVEILEGAQKTLSRFRPHLLIQAYHLREGVRTFESCAHILRGWGYTVEEHMPPSGLLKASK